MHGDGMRVSLVPVEVTAPEPDKGHSGCPVCCGSKPPARAYRPHTLDKDCWCTRYRDGSRAMTTCWVFTSYLAE